MIRRIFHENVSSLQRLLLRGARYQLLFIAFLIILVSVLFGSLVYIFTQQFGSLQESVWWAFLRLSDPGYLGDDRGLFQGTVSTIVTILGYVLFMGALIAIMTQWLQRTMRKLESGLTPITKNDHVLILGWTNRTPRIVHELALSEGRVKRFLKRIGASKLHIVILVEDVTPELAYDLKSELGAHWNEKQITFRSGTPIRIDHLRRVDFMNASVIIIPGADFAENGSEVLDTRTIKALLSISDYGIQEQKTRFPLVVSEIFDARKIPIAKSSYQGNIEVISSDSVISRLIAQNVRHKGLSYIYTELLTHSDGNEIYIREFPQFEGQRLQDLAPAFPNGVMLGILHPEGNTLKPILNPPSGSQIEKDDRLVVMATSYSDTQPLTTYQKQKVEKGAQKESGVKELKKKILIMGWNHKIPILLEEFDSYEGETFHVDILSLIPIAQREEYIERYDLEMKNVKLRHLFGDYTTPPDLRRAHPESYDNIVIVSNSWLGSSESSDARTILGFLLLKDMLPKDKTGPEILIELMDPENEKLFQQRKGEVIVSPLILSHIVAHVALRRELNVVFEELFTVGGAEIYFRSMKEYGLENRETGFSEIERAVNSAGEIALGIYCPDTPSAKPGGIHINPPRDSKWKIQDSDEVIVLTTCQTSPGSHD